MVGSSLSGLAADGLQSRCVFLDFPASSNAAIDAFPTGQGSRVIRQAIHPQQLDHFPARTCRRWKVARSRRYAVGMSDITRILSAIGNGEPQAAEQLLPLVYGELRKLAAARMAHENPGQTLEATALVHEVYLRLVAGTPQRWDSRGHFFASAAEAMRRILVEAARRKDREKHGGKFQRESLDAAADIPLPMPSHQLLALHEALDALEQQDPDAARLVKLRFFAGLSMPQIAETLDKPLRTLEREWTYARSWLHRAMAVDITPVR